MHYGRPKLTKTQFLCFDNHFQCNVWACGIRDKAMKLTVSGHFPWTLPPDV